MPIYLVGERLKLVRENKFNLEREIQNLVEKNLKSLLNLDLIKSEFTIGNFRIDTLAYDQETNSFVIIEFKRSKNFSVVDQGYAYLALMLNNKADFILEYNETQNKRLMRKNVDWSQSRVIFISQVFTTYQKEAINFKDLPIELWEINRYENNTISFKQIQKTNATESIKTISKIDDKNTVSVAKEIKVYTEEDHLLSASIEIKELFDIFKARIIEFNGDIITKAKKQTIDFRIDNKIFCDIIVQANALKIILNLKKGMLEDFKKIARDISSVGHWGNGDYELKLFKEDDLDYILSLVKQSYTNSLSN